MIEIEIDNRDTVSAVQQILHDMYNEPEIVDNIYHENGTILVRISNYDKIYCLGKVPAQCMPQIASYKLKSWYISNNNGIYDISCKFSNQRIENCKLNNN